MVCKVYILHYHTNSYMEYKIWNLYANSFYIWWRLLCKKSDKSSFCLFWYNYRRAMRIPLLSLSDPSLALTQPSWLKSVHLAIISYHTPICPFRWYHQLIEITLLQITDSVNPSSIDISSSSGAFAQTRAVILYLVSRSLVAVEIPYSLHL